MSRRTEKVQALLQQELGWELAKLELPAIATVSGVTVTDDLKSAQVRLTVLTDDPAVEERVLQKLQKNIREIQQVINKKMSMRNTPRIGFVLDHAEQYADHINKLLKQAHDEQTQQSEF